MNRIDRISAILIQLQSHSLVKAQQISERFVAWTRCQESISKQNAATRTVGNSLPQNRTILPMSLL